MPSRKYAPFFDFYRAFPHAARMLHISELSVRTAKPQIDDLVVLLGELLPVLDLSRQVGELQPESDILVDEILPLILRSVDGETVDSQTDVPREGGMHRRPLACAEALERLRFILAEAAGHGSHVLLVPFFTHVVAHVVHARSSFLIYCL